MPLRNDPVAKKKKLNQASNAVKYIELHSYVFDAFRELIAKTHAALQSTSVGPSSLKWLTFCTDLHVETLLIPIL